MAFLQEYTMLDELGRGGFATVYKVRHNELGYVRAIRVLNEMIAAKRGEDPKKSKTYQKFLNECRILLRLGNGNHPNIVHIYKPDLLENKALVEMDFVDGQDILHYLKQNHNFVPIDEVIRMAMQMSSALAYCHEDIYSYCMDRELDDLQDDPNDGSKIFLDDATKQRLIDKYKVIHNDIHSGNIMRRENGDFVLLDFGLAINGDEVVLSSSRHANGAPEFKAPEKWDDDSTLTEQTDIYSFGIVLYQFLAGRVPFPYNASTSGGFKAEAELCKAHQEATPPSIEDLRREHYEAKFEGKTYKRDFPKWLEDAILKCLRKDPAERFKNGRELYDFILAESSKDPDCFSKMELERITSENSDLISQVNTLNNANADLEYRLNSVQDKLTETQGALRNARKRIGDLENGQKARNFWWLWLLLIIALSIVGYIVISSYESQLANREQLVDSLIAENDSIKAQIEELSSSNNGALIKQKNTEIKSHKKEIVKLRKKVEEKEAEIKRLNGVIAKKESAAANTPKPDNSKEIDRLKQQIKDKEAEIKSLKEQVATLKKQPTPKDNSKELSDLKQQIKTKDAEIDRLKQQLASQNNSTNVSELQSKLRAAENQVTQLKQRLSDVQSKLEAAQRTIKEKERLIKAWENQ